jgi:FkbM family methyltransferase
MRKDLKINNGNIDYGFDLNNSLIFDVGLNVGIKSENLLLRGASVVGFEPQKTCFLKAAERLSRFENFKAENIALAKEEGESEIYISDAHTLTSMSQEFINVTKNTRFTDQRWNFFPDKVKTSTLDKMIAKYGKPKYIKIDVEGYEYEVLQGLTQPVEYISIEFTPELYQNTERCLDYLNNLNNGDCTFNYIYGENDHFMFKEWISLFEIKDYLSSVNDFLYEFGDVFIKMAAKNV